MLHDSRKIDGVAFGTGVVTSQHWGIHALNTITVIPAVAPEQSEGHVGMMCPLSRPRADCCVLEYWSVKQECENGTTAEMSDARCRSGEVIPPASG